MKKLLIAAVSAALLWAIAPTATANEITACVSKAHRPSLGLRPGDFYRVRTNGNPARCLGRDEQVALARASTSQFIEGSSEVTGTYAVLAAYGDPPYLEVRLSADYTFCDLVVWFDQSLGDVVDLATGEWNRPSRQFLVSSSSDQQARFAEEDRAWWLPLTEEVFRFQDAFVYLNTRDGRSCDASVTVDRR